MDAAIAPIETTGIAALCNTTTRIPVAITAAPATRADELGRGRAVRAGAAVIARTGTARVGTGRAGTGRTGTCRRSRRWAKAITRPVTTRETTHTGAIRHANPAPAKWSEPAFVRRRHP